MRTKRHLAKHAIRRWIRRLSIRIAQKSVLAVTRESLEYYDRLLGMSRDRYQAGDIAQVDLDRLQTALVNLCTAKIHLQAVSGRFDYADVLTPLEELRQNAFDSRADLRAVLRAVAKARTDYRLAVANGSTDPTFGWDFGRDPPTKSFFGAGITVFEGEKVRTQLDVERNERLVEANRSQVFSDVDSADAALQSNLTLLRPYKARHLQQAARVRETISFSYQHGGASLIDFLQAQQDYRGIHLSYLNQVGSSLSAANQLSFAARREVIP